jgi:hypothetical protein
MIISADINLAFCFYRVFRVKEQEYGYGLNYGKMQLDELHPNMLFFFCTTQVAHNLSPKIQKSQF